MTGTQSRDLARDLLKVVPLVMRTIAAELRAAGELPAPAHFGLLTLLSVQSRSLTEMASHQGVSLPTMSNSVSTLVERGWVRRTAPSGDRRIVIVELTPVGKSALDRVGRLAEAHLAELLAPVDAEARRRLQAGLAVLRKVFENTGPPGEPRRPATMRPAGSGGRTAYRK
jgi:DNA-binding MarR family transcriptional regulator